MNKTVLVWIFAVLLTLGAAVYQRMTGPTHPLRGTLDATDGGGGDIAYRLPRSHGGDGGQEVELEVPDAGTTATLVYRRYPTTEDWSRLPMRREGDRLFAELPHQSPAGKLEYFIEVASPAIERSLPTDRTVVIRFKGHVPLIVLLPHVILMFTAMLFSNAAGFEALTGGTRLKPYTIIAAVCLGLGGLILGPTVQNFAFGEFWTGIPWGYDLTDNKTLIAACFWAAAVWQVTRPPKSSRRWWVLAASLVLFAIYMIPHSAMGSELDPSTGEIKTGAAPHAIVAGERPA